MNEEVLQIARAYNDANNKLRFDLNINGLKEWVEPIKDKEVVVIPTVGPAQTGRSFHLNLIRHQLLNKGLEERITGFESRASIDQVTSGLWLSKPVIIQRDDGKEVAVLLLDTQSVFDGNTSVEDSNKVLWLCFLVSSCLIINVSTSLSEEFLQKLEPFLQYMKTNSGCAESLIFMIRDWNRTGIFKYGRKGGEQYLSNRLEIKDNAIKAINTKRWLKNCFKQIECYLWPGLGLDEDEGEFTGFAHTLTPNFKECLQEFCAHSLNANRMSPKIINNKSIKASELCQFFRVYVDLLNSTEQPNPMEITTATTKTLDFILIEDLKVQHSLQLQSCISRKNGFVSRKSLTDYNNKICGELKAIFDTKKRSEYPDVIESLNQSLDEDFQTNFRNAFEENEINRKNFSKLAVKDCENHYKSCLVKDFKNNHFFDSIDLNKLFEDHRTLVYRKLKDSFNGEEEELFDGELQILENTFSRLEFEFSKENDKRMLESEEKNTRALHESVEYYEQQVQNLIDSNKSLTDQQFQELEEKIKTKSRRIFRSQCCSGDFKFVSKFDKIFKERISQLKYDFKEQLRRQREKVIVGLEIDLIDISEGLNELVHTLKSKVEFEQEALKCKEKFMDEMKRQSLPEDLIQSFDKKLFSVANDLSSNFLNRTPRCKPREIISEIPIKQQESKLLKKAKKVYTEDMDNLFKDGSVHSHKDVDEMNSMIKVKSINCLKKALHKEGIPSGFSEHAKCVKELETFFDHKSEEYFQKNRFESVSSKQQLQTSLKEKTEEYFNMYLSKMRDSREGAISDTQYIAKHKAVKYEVMKSFEENELKNNGSFGFLPKLGQMIDSSCEEFLKPFQITSTEMTDERPVRPQRSTELVEVQFLAKIIEISPNGKYELNEPLLLSILAKAKNCNNFALISTIGRKFSSKTFFINCLKNYLESKDKKSWPKNCTFEYDQGFHTDTNDYSMKPVIQMWGQPFIIESDEQRTAVFLIDSSNVFIDDSEISNMGLVKDVIGLLLNISSTVLFMTESDIMTKEIETLKSIIEENLALTSREKYQELIWVLRDWSPGQFGNKNYLFGPKSGERYFNEINKLGKYELNKYFESLYCYLMPSAGTYQKRSTIEFSRLSDQFLVEMTNLIRLKVLNIDEMAVKPVMTSDDNLFPEHSHPLTKLLRAQINKLNGVLEPMDLTDSTDKWQIYDSGDEISIRVLDEDSSDDDIESYFSQ